MFAYCENISLYAERRQDAGEESSTGRSREDEELLRTDVTVRGALEVNIYVEHEVDAASNMAMTGSLREVQRLYHPGVLSSAT